LRVKIATASYIDWRSVHSSRQRPIRTLAKVGKFISKDFEEHVLCEGSLRER